VRPDRIRLAGLRERGTGETHGALQRTVRHRHAGPHGVEQFLLGYDAIAILREVHEQVEHARLHLNHPPRGTQLTGGFINFEGGEWVEHGRWPRRGAEIGAATVRKRSGHGKDFDPRTAIGLAASTTHRPITAP
jgi:hypothetical protein